MEGREDRTGEELRENKGKEGEKGGERPGEKKRGREGRGKRGERRKGNAVRGERVVCDSEKTMGSYEMKRRRKR